MSAGEWTEQELTEYLLGGLPANIRENLEQHYLADPALFERLEIAEDELVDGYVAGRLRWWTRRRFQRNYLASPPHRAKVSSARRLMQALAPRYVAGRAKPANVPLMVGYAAILAVAAGLSIWLASQADKQREVLQATESRPPSETSPQVTASAAGAPAFVLYPRTYRTLEEERRIEIPRSAEFIELRPLIAGDASLMYSGTLTRLNGMQIAGVQGKREDRFVRITVPAASLENGTYLLRLQSLDSGFQETYQFAVIRTAL